MGRLLGALVWALALASILLFVAGRWWFPPAISEHGPVYDRQFFRTMLVVGVAFAAAQIGLGYAVWRYRARPGGRQPRSAYTHGNSRLEILWTVLTSIVFVALAVLGQRAWAQLHFRATPADAARVRVVAQQFQWNFHYPGADARFGRTDPALVNDAGGNFVGLDEREAAAKDDVVVSTLVARINRPVELVLTSRDVTHSFSVPHLRFIQDAVPGLHIRVHFTPRRAGRYEVACRELCGQLHHRMKAYLLVLPEADYVGLMGMAQNEFVRRLDELSARPEYRVQEL